LSGLISTVAWFLLLGLISSLNHGR
jgi:hypothetical protein